MQYVKLARSLRLPGGSRPKQKAVAPMGEMGPVGGAEGGEELVGEDDEDEEFDLKWTVSWRMMYLEA